MTLRCAQPDRHGDTARTAGRNRGLTRRTRTLTGTATASKTAAAPAHAHTNAPDPPAALDPSGCGCGCGREAGGSRSRPHDREHRRPRPRPPAPTTTPHRHLPLVPPRCLFLPASLSSRTLSETDAPPISALRSSSSSPPVPSRSPVHLTLTLPQPPSYCLPSSSSSLRGRQPGHRRQTDAAHLLPLPLTLLPPRHQNKSSRCGVASASTAQRLGCMRGRLRRP